MPVHAATDEMREGTRFGFGANWRLFLNTLNDERIELAENSLKSMLEVETLEGRTFLDIGSGSGLFSVVARRLGAKVHSFDYDPHSVACTTELRSRYFPDDTDWEVEEGSALDKNYLDTLGRFDVVYSWGVLHHTGDMWSGLDNASHLVADGGQLYIAIYNYQRIMSRVWLHVKRLYNRLPKGLRWLVLGPAVVHLWGPRNVYDILRGRPFHTWRHYAAHGYRGMSAWHDVVDWVGGYPFEVAKPEEILDFFRERGFNLRKLRTCGGGLGCNEFVFRRHSTE